MHRREGDSLMQTIYQASEHFVTRSIAGDIVLVPVGAQTKRLNGFITFTESGQLLWQLLEKGPCTEDDLVAGLAREYEADPADLRADVKAFLEKGITNGLIIQSSQI